MGFSKKFVKLIKKTPDYYWSFLVTYSMNFFKRSFPFNNFKYSVLIKGGEVWISCDRFKLFSLNVFENSFSELIADRKYFDDRNSS